MNKSAQENFDFIDDILEEISPVEMKKIEQRMLNAEKIRKAMIEPTKITVEFYNKKISTEVDHSDVTLEQLHDMWLEIVKAMGYHEETIKEFYE